MNEEAPAVSKEGKSQSVTASPPAVKKPSPVRLVKDRKKDYYASARADSDLAEDVEDLYSKVVIAFQNKDDRNKNNKRYRDVYNCILNFSECQQYRGDSTAYVPTVADGIDGLVRRASNMLFPDSGRYTDCISEDGKRPQAKMALLDHYVDRTDLKSLVKVLMREGYQCGQFSVYVDWDQTTWAHTKKVPFAHEVDMGDDAPSVSVPVEGEMDVQDEEEVLAFPGVSVISDEDLAVVPETSDSTDEAIDNGGFVAIGLRVTAAWVKRQKRNKVFSKRPAEDLIKAIQDGAAPKGNEDSKTNPDKKAAEAAGVKTEGSHKFALVYQVWTKLVFPDSKNGEPELAVIHYAGPDLILAVKRCPFWIEKNPVLSVPDQKVKGSFWGISRIDRVEQLQYAVNDFFNIGEDSAIYALLPMFAVDPTSNPQYNSMVINMAALWKVAPDSIKPLTLPQIYQGAMEMVGIIEARINQSLGLTSSIIPQQGAKSKRSQAQVAEEQMAAIANISDEVIRIEQGILNPMLERFAEYDQQFRDDDLTISVYGELGMALRMENIPPNQFNDRYIFKWRGTQAFQSTQKLQQKMAGLNVLRGMPPQMLPGKKINLSPVVEEFVNETYGPRQGRMVLEDMEDQYSIPPDIENQMLRRNLPVIVRPTDDDNEHLKEHMQLGQDQNLTEGAKVHLDIHIQMHQAQLQAKSQAAQQKAMAEAGIQGAPGANGQPGMSGAPARGPRSGAVPGQPRQQGPAGMIHPDQMNDAVMPRRMG